MVLPSSALPAAEKTGRRVPIGIDEDALAPVLLDFDVAPHFLVIGESECGKSNLLRQIASALTERYTPDEARFVVFDYRQSLLQATESEHRIGYAASVSAAERLVRDVGDSLARRLPSADVTPQQLRARSWWKGPEVFVLADDYELVAAPSGNPLLPLAEFVSTARDVGLHVIVARGIGGAGRGMFDPIIQRVTDMASPALIMSGGGDEGVLAGCQTPPVPYGPGRSHRSADGCPRRPDRPVRRWRAGRRRPRPRDAHRRVARTWPPGRDSHRCPARKTATSGPACRSWRGS